jgi:hypothetical protein
MTNNKTKRRFGFSRDEYSILSKLNTPARIQDYLDRLDYNLEKLGETCYSPRTVLAKQQANCIEGAIFAAAVLRMHGHPPLILDLTSVRDDDHVLAVVKLDGCWGALSKSKYSGLSFREPIYRTLRELVLSYFECYFNFDSEKTLRGYSRPVNLSRFDKRGWMTSAENLFYIPEYLGLQVAHTEILTRKMIRHLRPVTPLMKDAGELWMKKKGILEKVRGES